MYCDSDKESNYIPGTEWLLPLVTVKTKHALIIMHINSYCIFN
jgi:hypothetical protein